LLFAGSCRHAMIQFEPANLSIPIYELCSFNECHCAMQAAEVAPSPWPNWAARVLILLGAPFC
jgi:hypothetical protein